MRKTPPPLLLLTAWPILWTGPAFAQASPTGPLTLAQANAQAAQSSPSLTSAAQSLAQARARVGQAQAQRRLQITFNSTASLSNAGVYQPPPSQETFGTLQNTLTVPLPLGARPGLAITQAQEQLGAAQAQYDSARLALAAQVAVAYFDLLRKQALLAVAQETLASDLRALGDAQKRQAAGDVAQLDVLQAQVPAASAQAALDGAENDLAVARQTLNSVLGRGLDADVAVAEVDAVAPVTSYTLDQARALAVQRSPDVRAADATVRADEAALSAARLYREPTLSLQAIDIRSKDVTSFSREDTVQAAVTLPLSDGGLGREQVREAQAALAGARAQVETTRRTVLASVSAAYLTAGSKRRQLAAALATQQIAQETYDKTRLGYQNGLFPLINVLNAQAALTQARIAYTQAVYDAAAAAAGLSAAFEGGTPTTTPASSTTAPAPSPPTTAPDAAGTGANGTSPAGANAPGTTPTGTSTTGTGAGGAGSGGRGTP